MASPVPPVLVGKAVTTPDSLPETSGQGFLLPRLGNRHGLIAGATGTGKTVTLMTLAEGFSRIGVPVFLAARERSRRWRNKARALLATR